MTFAQVFQGYYPTDDTISARLQVEALEVSFQSTWSSGRRPGISGSRWSLFGRLPSSPLNLLSSFPVRRVEMGRGRRSLISLMDIYFEGQAKLTIIIIIITTSSIHLQ